MKKLSEFTCFTEFPVIKQEGQYVCFPHHSLFGNYESIKQFHFKLNKMIEEGWQLISVTIEEHEKWYNLVKYPKKKEENIKTKKKLML